MLKKIVFILFQQHHDDSELSRGNSRLRNVFFSSVSNGILKLISLLIVYVSVRWGVNYLGQERFGLWMIITTMVTLFSVADFGINNGLVNLVSNASGRVDSNLIRTGVSNAIFGLSIVSVIIITLIIIMNNILNWEKLFSLKSEVAINEAGPTILAFFFIFALNQPATAAQKILIGMQKGWIANLWIGIGQILGLAGLWLAIYNKSGLSALILSLMAPQLLVNIAGSFLFFKKKKEFTPKIKDISRINLERLFFSGGLFFLIQIMSLGGNAIDNIIIASQLGAHSVSEFSVVQKLANTLGVAQLFIAPLWPAFGEAMSRGDYRWMRSTFIRTIYITSIISIISGILMIGFGHFLISIWTKNMINPSYSMLVGFSIFILVSSMGGCLSVLLNNQSLLHMQAFIYTLSSIISVVLKVVLTEKFQSASGAIWGGIIGYSIFFILPGMLIIFRYFKERIVLT